MSPSYPDNLGLYNSCHVGKWGPERLSLGDSVGPVMSPIDPKLHAGLSAAVQGP